MAGESIVKVCMKAGALEVEYEGQSDFLNENFFSLFEKFVDITKKNPKITEMPQGAAGSNNSSSDPAELAEMSTNTIATILQAKTCGGLAMAAAARLGVVEAKPKFKRQEIIDEMKTATTFYRNTYSGGNLTSALGTLVKGKRLLLQGTDEYALSAQELKELGDKLAQ